MNRIARIIFSLVTLAFASAPVLALDDEWPRTVALDEGMVTIYQPQVEALDSDVLYYRAALAYRPDADAEPIFGAGWLKAPVEIDEGSAVVHPTRLELTQARFPDGTADIQAEIATALLTQSARWNLDFSVDELEAALDAAEAESLAAQKLKTAPPKIMYRDHPALLVTIDGDPIEREIENSPYRAVINTPFPLITDGDDYFLNAARDVWYRASSATGPFRFDPNPPRDIVQMVQDAEAGNETGADDEDAAEPPAVTADNAPVIVVTTEPAELIVTDGPADFVPLVGDLLVLDNSDDDVFMHVGEQKYYIVLAGRWYTAERLEGPWGFQRADQLPSDFANIPDESAQADSRVYVAGTPEAEEAVLDAQVPQTAAVQRGEVDIDVAYDGDPDFEPVDGTEDLHYARNTGATVLESDRTYYLLEDGVWYVSSSPHGPWVVSDHTPGELDAIEPSSPVYNTKYVRVYDSTPDVVYVGYTPGYLGSYVYYDTIVYGTGWYYRPWVSPYYYYPRASTWGFHVGYSDWGGWSFGLSWYWPYYSANYYYGGYWHHGYPWYNRYWGYWGPRGYRYRPYAYNYGYHHDYRHGYRDGHYGDRHYDKGYGKGHRRHYDRHDKYATGHDNRWDNDYDRHGRERDRNLYRDRGQRARVADTRDRWRDDDSAPRRYDDGTRVVNNRKVPPAKTGPIRPADLRMKAKVRDVNRAAAREPMVASMQGEVYRASFDNGGPSDVKTASSRNRNRSAQRDAGAASSRDRDVAPAYRRNVEAASRRDQSTKVRQSRTEPISRAEMRQRGDRVARRNDSARPSVNRPMPEPSRSVERSNREFASQPRQVQQQRAPQSGPSRQANTRAPESRSSRQASPPKRQTGARVPENRSSRQVTSQPRQVQQQRAPQARTSRQATSQPRQVQQQRAPQTRPSRQTSAPDRREPPMQSRTPTRQVDRTPSRPQRTAPAPRQQQRSAPRQQQRSEPRQQQRSEPRQQQRSAPRQQQRSAPQQRAERGSERRDSGNRGQRRRKD